MLQAQQRIQLDPNTSFMFQEFQALVIEENEEVKVRFRLGRQTEGGGDQLQAGDLIIMMDGKRIKTLQELKDQYAAAEKDAEMRIGVRRGEERFILRAKKGDIPEGGSRQITRSAGSGSATGTTTTSTFSVGGSGSTGSSGGIQLATGGPGNDGAMPPGTGVLTELGLVLSTNENVVTVTQVIDVIAPQQIKNTDITRGSIIKEINGEKITSAEQALKIFKDLETGEKFSLMFENDGIATTMNWEKPASTTTFTRN